MVQEIILDMVREIYCNFFILYSHKKKFASKLENILVNKIKKKLAKSAKYYKGYGFLTLGGSKLRLYPYI